MGLTSTLKFKSKPGPASRSTNKLISICNSLLSDSDGVSGSAGPAEAVALYETLDHANRLAFFDRLVRDFSPRPDDVGRIADDYRLDPSPANLKRLQHVVEPPRQELFRRLNMAPGGTHTLVEMRSFVLAEVDRHPHLEAIADDLGHLLASWFNSGFLTLERIDWNSPAVILEKLIEYEAVHQIQGWPDLRRRLEADRRCFGFFHSALPNEPLIFIEVALTRGVSDRIQPLLDPEAPVGDPAVADSAIFYSITNCQPGLRGVPLGSSLIKQVVENLRQNLPKLRVFATLSPIPGFRKWLDKQLANPDPTLTDIMAEPETSQLFTQLDEPSPAERKWSTEQKQRLLSLCAWYLLKAKRDAEPLDPVARFHLRNGASVDRINWMADSSAAGIRQSAGLMTNYLYELRDLERNHELYTSGTGISASGLVDRLARQPLRDKSTNWLTRHFG